MTEELQPVDRSDTPPLSPKELLRHTVIRLADTLEDNLPGGGKWGIVSYSPERFLVAEIIDLPRQSPAEAVMILQDRFLMRLSAYNSHGKGSVESIMIGDSNESLVIADVNQQEAFAIDPQTEDDYIIKFFERNRIRGRSARRIRPPRMP